MIFVVSPLVHDDPIDGLMTMIAGVVNGDRMTVPQRVMIDRCAVIIDDRARGRCG